MKTKKQIKAASLCLALCCFFLSGQNSAVSRELETFKDVEYISTDWADGDSFRISFRDGEEATLRLYAVDCIEKNINNKSDATRLREQRRYFGIFEYENSPRSSIELAKTFGTRASDLTASLLDQPFTVHTAFADGRGDEKYKRIYAFVTLADGRDLGKTLVEKGLARAFGVYRKTPDGMSREDHREYLKDAELVSARNNLGVWKYTDWEKLPLERKAQREENMETKIAKNEAPIQNPINLNTAAREELMKISGIGEVTANAIIESRPYTRLDELLQVRGIGPKSLERIQDWLFLE